MVQRRTNEQLRAGEEALLKQIGGESIDFSTEVSETAYMGLGDKQKEIVDAAVLLKLRPILQEAKERQLSLNDRSIKQMVEHWRDTYAQDIKREIPVYHPWRDVSGTLVTAAKAARADSNDHMASVLGQLLPALSKTQTGRSH